MNTSRNNGMVKFFDYKFNGGMLLYLESLTIQGILFIVKSNYNVDICLSAAI